MPVNNPRHSRFFWRSSAMFSILDFERQFKEVNSAWETTLGLSTGQLLAKCFLDFVHPEDRPSSQYYFEKLDKGSPSFSFSNRFRHYDGSYRTILWEINSAASVEYAYYVVGMDITAREQPMIADEMITVLQEGVVLQYANGTIGACNPSAERILGLSSEQMMGWILVDPDWKLIREDGSLFPTESHPAICTLRTGQPYSNVVIGVVRTDDSILWLKLNSHPLWRDEVTPYAVVISFSDITSYKETEQNLRQQDIDRPPVGIGHLSANNYDLWNWNLTTNEINFSSRWKTMLGFEEQELANHIDTWHQRIHPADYKRVMTDIQNHLGGVTPLCENVHRLQHKDGNYRWILNSCILVKDSVGQPHHIVGTHIDVTEPRRIEEELQETEKKYRQLMETETDALFIIDANTTDILDVNRTATQMYGYSRNQLLKTKKIELSAQPDKTVKAIKKGVKYTSQQYHKKQDGTVFPVEVIATPFVWKNRQVLMVAVRDMTERQRIETALWESESKYRQLFEAASYPIVVLDANTQQFFDVNRAAIDLYGYTKEEWLHMTAEDISAESIKKRTAFSNTGKKQLIPLRWHKKKDGTVFPIEISTGNTYLFQGRSLICATLRDITERKVAEEALRKEKDFINTLVQASPAFFFAVSPDGKLRMINKAMLVALEYSPEEVANAEFLSTFVPKAERSLVSTEFNNLTKSMQPSLLEYHVLSKSGKSLLVEWHSRAIVKPEGTLDFFFGVGIDVTERKKAQGHLRLFKSIIESSEEAIAVTNIENQLIYANPAYEKLIGRSIKEIKQLSILDYYSPNSAEIWEKQIIPRLVGGGSWEGELDIPSPQNSLISIWQRVDAVRDAKGGILFSFALMHDISERKKTWETLRQQLEEYQKIFDLIPAMIWYRDKNNQLIRTNKFATETFKPQDEQIKLFTDCTEVLKSGRAQYGIVQNYRKALKEHRWMQIDKIPYQDSQENMIGAVIFGVDVTEYKQTQAHLQASEERMYLVVENMPMMLHAFDTEGRIVAWNRACEDITGYSVNDMLGNIKALDILYPEVTERHSIMEKLDNYEGEWENRLTCKDGRTRTILWNSVAKRFPIPGWHAWFLGQDVTQRKSVEKFSRENESMIASTVDSSKLGICLTDDRGKFIQVNRAYAELYGYRPDELIGQPFTFILPSSLHNDAIREYYSLLLTHEEPTLFRRRGEQHRNGHTFDVQVMASRVVLEDRRRFLLSIIKKCGKGNSENPGE